MVQTTADFNYVSLAHRIVYLKLSTNDLSWKESIIVKTYINFDIIAWASDTTKLIVDNLLASLIANDSKLKHVY